MKSDEDELYPKSNWNEFFYIFYLSYFLWKKRESVTRLPCAWSANMEKNPSQAILDHSRFRKSQRSQRADPVMWILIHSHAQPSGFTRISSSTKLRLRLLLFPVTLGTIYENSFRMGRLTSIHPRLIKHRISIKVVNQIDNRDHCEARQMASLPIKAIRFILAPQVGI